MSGPATIFDRLRDMDARIRKLEASAGSGLSGTDQTIKGSHDRLDALIGAATATPGALKLTGANSGAVIAHIPRKTVTDDTATGVFTVTTANETGDNDAGHWTAFVYAICANGGHAVTSIYASNMGYFGVVTRAQEGTGTGVSSAVTETVQTASAATDAAVRDVTGVVMTVAETSEYVTEVQFKVTGSGTGSRASSMTVTALVVLAWSTFTTAPVITAL